MQHLVFYDGKCGLCDHTVRFLLKQDQNKRFAFAPLHGPTAKKLLSDLPSEIKEKDSLILIENYQTKQAKQCIEAKAVFRILWYLGGIWVIPGLLSFLPGLLFNFAYRLVARNRNRIFSNEVCFVPGDEEGRFLP